MNTRPLRSRAVRALLVLGVGAVALSGRRADAVVTDALAIDLATHQQGIAWNWASNPSPGNYSYQNLTFNPSTRTAYTQAAPLSLPCDVNQLSIGMAFRNVGAQPLYGELSGTIAINGDEHDLLTNLYGQTEPHAALNNVLVPPSGVSTGGFIFIALPPLYDFATEQLPANVPLKIRMRVAGYTDSAYDTSRGGYFLSSLISESTVWNNAWALWVRRTCP